MEIDRCVCALCVYDIIYIIHRERQRYHVNHMPKDILCVEYDSMKRVITFLWQTGWQQRWFLMHTCHTMCEFLSSMSLSILHLQA